MRSSVRQRRKSKKEKKEEIEPTDSKMMRRKIQQPQQNLSSSSTSFSHESMDPEYFNPSGIGGEETETYYAVSDDNIGTSEQTETSTSSSSNSFLEDSRIQFTFFLNHNKWDWILILWCFLGGAIRSMAIGLLMIIFGRASSLWRTDLDDIDTSSIWPHLAGVLQLALIGPVEVLCVVFLLFMWERFKQLSILYAALKLSIESVFLIESLEGRIAAIPWGDHLLGLLLLVQSILLPLVIIWRTSPFSRTPVFPRSQYRRSS